MSEGLSPSIAEERGTARACVPFLILLLVTAGYQAFYCYTTTRGELSGLFFCGERIPQPPALRRDAFIHRNSDGYDSQYYRLLAHDPLDRHGFWKYLGDPRYRSRRILIPAVAALLGAGSPFATDFWFVAVTDVLIALGGVCFVRLAAGHCPWYFALALYSAIPAVVASTDRMVLDGPAVAGFLAAWLFYREGRRLPLLAVLTLVPLVRESGICVTAGIGLACLASRQYRDAALAALTTVPAAAWWWFVSAHTPPSQAGALLSIPLWPQVMRLFTPFSGPVSPGLNLLLEGLDWVACVCLLIAFACVARARPRTDTLIVLPAAVLAAFAGSRDIMNESYSFMRIDSVLVAWVAWRMLAARRVYAAIFVAGSSLGLLVFRAGPFLRLLGR